jgi:hypothetical protein
MTRRRWLLLGLPAGLALGLGTWVLRPVPTHVRAYERIRLGMMRHEVEAALAEGSDEDDPDPEIERSRSPALFVGMPFTERIARASGTPFPKLSEEHFLDGWQWDDYEIWVAYDPDGRVVARYLLKSWFRSPTWFERVPEWLGI